MGPERAKPEPGHGGVLLPQEEFLECSLTTHGSFKVLSGVELGDRGGKPLLCLWQRFLVKFDVIVHFGFREKNDSRDPERQCRQQLGRAVPEAGSTPSRMPGEEEAQVGGGEVLTSLLILSHFYKKSKSISFCFSCWIGRPCGSISGRPAVFSLTQTSGTL